MDKKLTAETPKCPACGRATMLYRVRTDSYLCRACGHQWPREAERSDQASETHADAVRRVEHERVVELEHRP